MCLIVFANGINQKYKLILAGNRDEYYKRVSLPFKWYKLSNNDYLLSPKDLLWKGSWFGITKKGKIAFVTNYRNPLLLKNNVPSRGKLVWDYLNSNYCVNDFIKAIQPEQFNPFNLVFGSIDRLYYFSNVKNELIEIEKNIHGLSNHLLDSQWPKVTKATNLFKSIIDSTSNSEFLISKLFEMLSDTTIFENNLPDTFIGIQREKILSSIFVKSDDYGTQTSYVLLVDIYNKAILVEKNYLKNDTHNFNFSII